MLLWAIHELCWEEPWEMEWWLVESHRREPAPYSCSDIGVTAMSDPLDQGSYLVNNGKPSVYLFICSFIWYKVWYMHHFYLISKQFHHLKRQTCTHEAVAPHNPLSLALGSDQFVFCLYEFTCSRYFIYTNHNNMWNFVSGFFHLAWGSSTLSHISVLHSFLFMSE